MSADSPTAVGRRRGARRCSRRSSTCSGCSASTTPSAPTSSSAWAARIERDLGDAAGAAVRAEGRRPRGRHRLRARPDAQSLATRGDGRVGEDVTYNVRFIPRDPQDASTATAGTRCPSWSRCAARSTSRPRRFDALNAEVTAQGLLAVRQRRATPGAGTLRQRIDSREAELAAMRAKGSTTVAAPRRASSTLALRARSSGLRLVVHGIGVWQGHEPVAPVRGLRRAARAGACPPPTARRSSPGLAGVQRVHRLLRRAPPRRRARDRRRRGQGRRPRHAGPARLDLAARRAGRSPTSTRPRSCAPGCSTSRSTSAAPAGSRRSR